MLIWLKSNAGESFEHIYTYPCYFKLALIRPTTLCTYTLYGNPPERVMYRLNEEEEEENV